MAAKIRSSVGWQKTRDLHRAQFPLCCDPMSRHPEHPKPNQNSHHIIPLIERPDLALDLDNLAATCTACHAEIERMERAGKATRFLFTTRQSLPNDQI
jgi:hypothetical protein